MQVHMIAFFVVNFIIDYMLLLGTNRICGNPLKAGRCAVGAIIGSTYVTICMLPGFQFLQVLLWRIVSFCIIVVAAFGVSLNTLRRACVFAILSVAMGGIATGLDIQGTAALLIALLIVTVLCHIGFCNRLGSTKLLPVEIYFDSRKISVTALYDTGNTLRDPVTGRSVLIVDANIARELIGLQPEQLRDPVKTIAAAEVPGLRLIPYKTVGNSDGLLLALYIPVVKINKKMKNVMVAFAPEKLSGDGTYQALTGGTI